ncbi:MAG: hypothetical protein KIS92_22135 [Planctomycetota bacterium]|nr:hypothetical protein [Planctomycetota bacterium]
MEIIFGLFGCGMGLFVYLFMSVSIMTIANKTGTPDAWWAWLPILNVLLLLRIGGKP